MPADGARSWLAAVLGALALGSSAAGATLEVCQAGGAAFASIQMAVDAASDGDVIALCAGVHRESAIYIFGKSLRVQGRGRGQTVVEPPVPASIFTVFGPAEVSFQHLTLRHGEGYDGGALEVLRGDVALTDCAFVGNTAVDRGGAVYLDRAALTVSNCRFEDNSAGLEGGAIHARRAASVIIAGSSFTGNVAGGGGALAVAGAEEVVITVTDFWSNAAEFAGGALAVAESGTLILDSSTVTGNLAARFGGIRLEKLEREAVIEGCAIRHNTSGTSFEASSLGAGRPGRH